MSEFSDAEGEPVDLPQGAVGWRVLSAPPGPRARPVAVRTADGESLVLADSPEGYAVAMGLPPGRYLLRPVDEHHRVVAGPAPASGRSDPFSGQPDLAHAELRERLAGRRVVASISGGKDSAALSLFLAEQGIDHDRVHLLTGWDSPVTLEYLRGPLTAKIGPILEVRGPMTMEDLIRRKGIFPSRLRRFCSQHLKVFPMQRYLRELVDAGADLVNAVGIRRAESLARAKMSEWEWSEGFDCEVWRPLAAWSTDDVIAIHQRHGLRPNPLYLRGMRRVGCWPCIMSSKAEIRIIADTDPAQIDRLRALEQSVQAAALARRSDSLRVLQEDGAEALSTRQRKTLLDDSGGVKGFLQPTFFQSATGGAGAWGIDRVVEWSRTLRGGRVRDTQEDLFGGVNDGCARWGLCEAEDDD